MKIIAYLFAEWNAFAAAIENLVNWHKATGTVPLIPAPPAAAGPTTPPPAIAPPQPPAPPSATPLAGMSLPRADGAVQLTDFAASAQNDPNFAEAAGLWFVGEFSKAYPQTAETIANHAKAANAAWLANVADAGDDLYQPSNWGVCDFGLGPVLCMHQADPPRTGGVLIADIAAKVIPECKTRGQYPSVVHARSGVVAGNKA